MTYALKRSKRARYMRLAVFPGGSVVVTAPVQVSDETIGRFVENNARWIDRTVARLRDRKALPVRGRRAYLQHKEVARSIIAARVRVWSAKLSVRHERIAIKDTRSLWGSCSRRGNLNFSYKLIFLPEELLDYVVVHELCHLREPNHSPTFWQHVKSAQPEYIRLRSDLRAYLLR